VDFAGGEDFVGEAILEVVGEAEDAEFAKINILGVFGKIGQDDEVESVIFSEVAEDVLVIGGEESHDISGDGMGALPHLEIFLN
jgi:hypothetical protein